jgi:hypothetical protein
MKLKIILLPLLLGTILNYRPTQAMTYVTNPELHLILKTLNQIDDRLKQMEKTQACKHLKATQAGPYHNLKCRCCGASLK